MNAHAIFILALLLSFAPILGRAESPIADEVRLHDGSMARGIIVERVPDDYLVLLLPSGELRRYELTEVEYAGPVERTTSPANAREEVSLPAPMSLEHAQFRVRLFSTGERELSVHRRVGTAFGYGSGRSFAASAWAPVCTTPCETLLPYGLHSLYIENHRGKKAALRTLLSVSTDMDLELTWESRRRHRIVRWTSTLALLGTGTWALLRGLLGGRRCEGDFCGSNLPLTITGASLLAGGYTMLFVSLLTFDRSKIEAHPFGSLTEQ